MQIFPQKSRFLPHFWLFWANLPQILRIGRFDSIGQKLPIWSKKICIICHICGRISQILPIWFKKKAAEAAFEFHLVIAKYSDAVITGISDKAKSFPLQ